MLAALHDLWDGVTDALTGARRCRLASRRLPASCSAWPVSLCFWELECRRCCAHHALPLNKPTNSLTCPPADETDVVCAAACAALAQLLQDADSQGAPGSAALPATAATVLSDLTDSVHKRLGGRLSQALARFRCGARGARQWCVAWWPSGGRWGEDDAQLSAAPWRAGLGCRLPTTPCPPSTLSSRLLPWPLYPTRQGAGQRASGGGATAAGGLPAGPPPAARGAAPGRAAGRRGQRCGAGQLCFLRDCSFAGACRGSGGRGPAAWAAGADAGSRGVAPPPTWTVRLPPTLACSPAACPAVAVGRCHAHEECAVLLGELLHCPLAAVQLAAAEALLELAKVGRLACFMARVLLAVWHAVLLGHAARCWGWRRQAVNASLCCFAPCAAGWGEGAFLLRSSRLCALAAASTVPNARHECTAALPSTAAATPSLWPAPCLPRLPPAGGRRVGGGAVSAAQGHGHHHRGGHQRGGTAVSGAAAGGAAALRACCAALAAQADVSDAAPPACSWHTPAIPLPPSRTSLPHLPHCRRCWACCWPTCGSCPRCSSPCSSSACCRWWQASPRLPSAPAAWRPSGPRCSPTIGRWRAASAAGARGPRAAAAPPRRPRRSCSSCCWSRG